MKNKVEKWLEKRGQDLKEEWKDLEVFGYILNKEK